MAAFHGTFTVTTTAAQLPISAKLQSNPSGDVLVNSGVSVEWSVSSGSVFIGGSDVTASGAKQGFPINTGDGRGNDSYAGPADLPFFVTASGTATVVYWGFQTAKK